MILLFATDFSLLKDLEVTQELARKIGSYNLINLVLSTAIIVLFFVRETRESYTLLEKSEKELRVKYQELKESNQKLQDTNKELDLLVYSATHDLRAPVTSLKGLLELCRIDAGSLDTYLNLQEKSLDKLDYFIQQILHYYRNTRLDTSSKKIEFEEVINDILMLYRVLIIEKRIQPNLKITAKHEFYGDMLRIYSLLNNLISNAIRYMNPSSTAPFIEIHIEINAKEAVIQVRDNGLGIPPEHLPNIFEMFYRGNNQSIGSGMGLFIVKETVKKMQGTITATSTLKVGTTFTVVVPNRPAPEISLSAEESELIHIRK